jgi:ubiquinol-cytochrome c reductase cytochrome c1 subunit
MRRLKLASLVAAGLTVALAAVSPVRASEDAAPARQEWHHGAVGHAFSNPFGTFDRAALQRGYQVYKEVCSACHSMNLLAYRDLHQLGFSEEEVKALAAQYEVTDGPNDQGEMFTRKALPSDHFKAPFANEQAARAANNGAYPKDLSLIVKARENGEDYIYALMTSYAEAPADHPVAAGMYYNKAFPGHQIAMPEPLSPDRVTYADGTKATVEQMAHDVATFLAWAAEPNLEARHRIGVMTMMFLLVFAGIMYAAKRRVWADQH